MEELRRTFDGIWNEGVKVLPTLLLGLLLLIGGWIIAKLVSILILRLFTRKSSSKLSKMLSFDTINERLGTEINFPRVVAKLFYWIIFLFFVVVASESFGWHNVSRELTSFVHYIPKLLSALLIFVLGYSIARFVRDSIKSVTNQMEIGVGRISAEIIFFFLLVVVSLTALSQTGIDTSLLSANIYILLGALALAFALSFGWGAKDVVSDLLKNYYNRSNINVGDEVEFEKETGIIERVSKTTVVLNIQGELKVIPAQRFYESTYIIKKQQLD